MGKAKTRTQKRLGPSSRFSGKSQQKHNLPSRQFLVQNVHCRRPGKKTAMGAMGTQLTLVAGFPAPLLSVTLRGTAGTAQGTALVPGPSSRAVTTSAPLPTSPKRLRSPRAEPKGLTHTGPHPKQEQDLPCPEQFFSSALSPSLTEVRG